MKRQALSITRLPINKALGSLLGLAGSVGPIAVADSLPSWRLQVMRTLKVGLRTHLPTGLLALVMAVALPLAVPADALGVVKIEIEAENLSTTDTPFCGVGPGLVGDKLDVDVSTDLLGATTGTATFEDANGNITTLNIDTGFAFGLGACCGGGIALRDSSNPNINIPTIGIWLDDDSAPAHVNVELPGGCGGTVSTFTSGVDDLEIDIEVE